MTIDPSIIKKIALDIIETLTELEENSTSSDTYLKSNLLKYSEPNSFYVEVFARFTRVLIPEKDNHFKNLAWEKLNFAKNRFSLCHRSKE